MQWLVSYRDGNVVCRYMLASHCMYLSFPSLTFVHVLYVVYILVSQNIMHHTHRKGEGSHTHDRVSYWGKYTSSSGQWWKDHLSTQTPKDYVWICRCAPDIHSWGVKLSCDQQQVIHVIGKLSLPLLHCIVDLTPLQ